MRTPKFFDADTTLLVTFILLSGWAFVTAGSFPERDALFPRISSAVILVGATLVLVIKSLPADIRESFESTNDLFDTDEIAEDDPMAAVDVDHRKRFLLIGLTALYLIVGYLVGLLWATPLFVLAYSLSVKHPIHITVLLTGLAYGIAYAFMDILNLSIDSGVFSIGL